MGSFEASADELLEDRVGPGNGDPLKVYLSTLLLDF